MTIEKSENSQGKNTTAQEKSAVSTGVLSSKLRELLIAQLAHELRNHNLYLSFSNFYADKGLNLLSEYYKLRAKEEYTHHEWIRQYLNDNEIVYKYPAIDEIDETFETLLDPFKLTVEVEEITTDMIYDIADQATKENDHITIAWLYGKDPSRGMLVLEQLEEQSLSKAALDIAKLDDGWLIKEKAIMSLYNS